MGRHGKQYSGTEFTRRLMAYRMNSARIARLNQEARAEGRDTQFALNKFSDLTPAEFRAKYLSGYKKSGLEYGTAVDVEVTEQNLRDLPDSFNWVDQGKTTPVKDQQQCGSCWAFSATETIESAWFLAGNPLVNLAPQQIVDCDTTDSGCNGGWPYNAYAYIMGTGGQEPEVDYPYQGVDGTCQFNAADVAATITGWSWVSQDPSTENTTMLNFIGTTGPVSVCVDASSWQFYTGGVLQTCTDNIDHCVQVTGYGQMDGLQVWNVRNSWGAWGNDDSGYIYIERGLNLCLIASYVTTVTA